MAKIVTRKPMVTAKPGVTNYKPGVAAKTAAASATKASVATCERCTDYVVIDHPKNNEVIGKGHYCFRIGASKCDSVEISLDDQPWKPCRSCVGYYWYDCNSNTVGSHQIVARLNKKGVEPLVSRRRRFKVA